jgi:hypothetical protein
MEAQIDFLLFLVCNYSLGQILKPYLHQASKSAEPSASLPKYDPIIIKNNGGEISETNFWDSAMAKAGFLFLSWNAGVARVLVPAKMNKILPEIKTGEYCIISQGPHSFRPGELGLELLFEDHSDAPYAVQMSSRQADRVIECSTRPEDFPVSIWTRAGVVHSMPGKLRAVSEVPYLQPW